jgi:proteasome lid subunit RPN8/RPN11
MEYRLPQTGAVRDILARFPTLSKPYFLHIPRHLYDAMLAQAVAEMPNECCGLLAGTARDGIGLVTQRYPLVNVAPNPAVEYLAEPGLPAAVRSARERGAEVIAIYHSHPTSAPLPSRKDRDMSPGWGEIMVHLIISLAAGEPEVKAWRLTATDSTEAEWRVVAEPEKGERHDFDNARPNSL